MSLAEKVGQLFVFTWRNRQEARNNMKYHPGGFIRIYSDALTVARETAEIQQQSRIPLVMAADFERGIGGTVAGPLETVTAMAIGATCDESAAFDCGYFIGNESLAMGINMDYAPVLDVNSNPKNPVINTRSFGQDPHLVARMGVAFMRGLQKAGVIACGKHFPGHGDSGFDSHATLGSISASRKQLDSIELIPFNAAIAAGIDSIMSAHLHISCIDSDVRPATLSPAIITGLLRQELGFQGVVVTDALDMGAIAEEFPPEMAIPAAVNAGCDQLIMPKDSGEAYDILLAAVKRGEVAEDRLDESVHRILTMKANRCGIPDYTSLPARVSVPAHIQRVEEIAAKSITLMKGQCHLPLSKEKKYTCLAFHNSRDSRKHYLEPYSFGDYLAADNWNVDYHILGNLDHASGPNLDKILASAATSEAILLAGYVQINLSSGTIELPQSHLDLLQQFKSLGKPVLLVSFGSPYLIKQLDWVDAYICAYSATQPSQQAAARAVRGEIPCQGKLPISLD